MEFNDPADVEILDNLGKPGQVPAGIPEPLDVPGAEDQVGGLAGLDVDGLGPDGSGPVDERDREKRSESHNGTSPSPRTPNRLSTASSTPIAFLLAPE